MKDSSLHAGRQASHWPVSAVIMVLAGAMTGLAVLSLHFGPVRIGMGDVMRGLFSLGGYKIDIIIQELRLPRTLLAMTTGATLGLSGAVLQGLLRNPLAEPGTIGISASAGLGGVIAIYHGLFAISPLAVPLCAIAGCCAATLILYAISARGANTLGLILAGVAIGSLSSALISLTMNLSDNAFVVSEMVFWLLGSVNNSTMFDIALSLPFVMIGLAILLRVGKSLDGLSLGEETAQSLGLNLRQTRLLVIIGVSLCVGPSVAVTGGIGFVGLVAPHLLRPVVGSMPSRLMIPSALAGACLLLTADIGVRILAMRGPELNLGVVTALVGAPFFLHLILRSKVGTHE